REDASPVCGPRWAGRASLPNSAFRGDRPRSWSSNAIPITASACGTTSRTSATSPFRWLRCSVRSCRCPPAPDQQIDRVYSPNYNLTPPGCLLRSWVPAAAPIGTGDDFHEVTVWIFEIATPASIVMVDFLLFRLCGVGPISQPAFAYSPEYLVELCFTDQE